MFKATSIISLHLSPVDTGHRFASFLSVAFHNAGYQLFSSPALSLGLRSIGAYFSRGRRACRSEK